MKSLAELLDDALIKGKADARMKLLSDGEIVITKADLTRAFMKAIADRNSRELNPDMRAHIEKLLFGDQT